MFYVLSIYEEANVEDIPILLELARRRFGLGFIRNRQGFSYLLRYR
jgi:hypothetical protein